MMASFYRYFSLLAFASLFFLSPGEGFSQSLSLVSQTRTIDSTATDVWGYVDSTGTEYAIVGSWDWVSIYDLSTPSAPVRVGYVPNTPGFDVKVWDHYIYAVNGNTQGQANVIDIADPGNPQVVGNFPNAHNIFIDDRGYLYTAFGGFRIYDLNSNPMNPPQVFIDTSATVEGHDVHVIGDTAYFFDTFFDTKIYDVSNPTSPQLLGTIVDPNITYHHSGWPTEDRQYLLILDELAKKPSPDISIWDISNLSNPQRVGDYSDTNAIVHNTFIIGDYAYTSYYMEGLRIFDVSNLPNLPVVAEYFTFPDSSVEAFNGAFGIYPYAPSGLLYVSDMTYGLFVLRFDTTVSIENPTEPGPYVLEANYPNPFQASTRINYTVEAKSYGGIEILDQQGKLVYREEFRDRLPGTYTFDWKGLDAQGRELPVGFYYYRVGGERPSAARSMLLLRK